MTSHDSKNSLNDLLLEFPNRRQLLKRFSVLVVCAASELALPVYAKGAVPAGTALSSVEKKNLHSYAYLLVPLLKRSHPRYQQVSTRIVLIAENDAELAGFIRGGIAELETQKGDSWDALQDKDKIARLKSLHGSPFFGFLRWFTAESVMREPTLWKKLGYEGSSLEFGGYLNRGFDDIDWLPAAAKEGRVS